MESIDITCKLQDINSNTNEISLSAFNFSFDNQTFLISTNHGLPIESCNIDNNIENKVTKYIDSVWNELIIFKTESPIEDTIVFTKHINKIPKNHEILFVKKNGKNIRLTNAVPFFMPLNGIPTNPNIIYIKADVLDNSIEKSYSGSPVFNESKKLIGILSKRNIKENTVYIIPVYILIKTLMKNDNTSLYSLDHDIPIKKIGIINVKNDFLIHKILGVQMNVHTYCLLEGDKDLYETVDGKEIPYVNINEYLPIDNNKDIIQNKSCYKLTVRLFLLLKLLYSDLGKDMYNILQKHYENTITLYVNKNRLRQKKYIELKNSDVNLKFVITPNKDIQSLSTFDAISSI